MNDRDSELVAGMLIKAGYKLAESIEQADIVLFNTCSVRQKAEDKVWSEIGRLKLGKDDHSLRLLGRRTKDAKKKIVSRPSEEQRDERSSIIPRKIVGLIGCMAQVWQQAVFDKAPFVDLVVGPNNISAIPKLLKDMQSINAKGLAVGASERDAIAYNTEYIAEKSHCNVNIMEGCNNFCSYCIVPYARGRERSRPAEDIIKEIKTLVGKGVKGITLLGQNVNSYRGTRDERGETKDEGRKTQTIGYKLQDSQHNTQYAIRNTINFVDLLKMVNDIEGLEKFDFVTSHPKDADTKLFKAMAELPKCRKFLHLPVQSGSDRILKMMLRGYTRSKYLDLVKKAKQIMPELRLTTDVMVGFPTETEKDFENTFELMKQAQFSAAYIFKYSPRPFTKAAQLEDDVPKEVKKERNQILLNYQRKLHSTRSSK
ncbi:MAG: MiaB/RimO family radical SAM methylthiotransferase [Candidatus Omnitrophota bacterium]